MGHKCVLKNTTAGSKPYLFVEPQELGIGVKSMKKVEKMRNEAEGGWAVLLQASSVGDQQAHRAGGRSVCVDQQAPHKGKQETIVVMSTQRSAWGACAYRVPDFPCGELPCLFPSEPISCTEEGCTWLKDMVTS